MRLCVTVRFPGGATLYVWRDGIPEVGSTFTYRARRYKVRAVHGRSRPIVELVHEDADVEGHAVRDEDNYEP
jgi:hypothetical protein